MRSLMLMFSAWVVLGVGNSFAQNADRPAPTMPLVRRAPAFASWSVVYHYKDQAAQVASAKTPYTGDRQQSVVVTKTDKIYAEQTTWISGLRGEKWTFDGVQLKSIAGTRSIVPVDPPSKENPEPDYTDYRKSDFPELGWISLQNYKGVGNYQGQPVYLFESSSGKKMVAGLSTETQLPLYSNDGETTLTYTYNPPPTTKLVPPEEFSKVIKVHKRGLEKLKYSPVPM